VDEGPAWVVGVNESANEAESADFSGGGIEAVDEAREEGKIWDARRGLLGP
jgi:hypothetical protein